MLDWLLLLFSVSVIYHSALFGFFTLFFQHEDFLLALQVNEDEYKKVTIETD